MDPRVERTITVMEERLHTRLTRADLAGELSLSVSQLSRLFRRETGGTLAAHLRSLRMARARTLLERTSLSVSEVMARVGISDPSHFARDFRRVHGFSPRTFGQQVQIGHREGRHLVGGQARPPLTDRESLARGRGAPDPGQPPQAWCYVCPVCGAGDTQVTLPSRDGAYCQCSHCGHQWHDDHKPPARGTPALLRRKDDR